ncbi:unnamed protein product [Schistocephalus solidus]|uniref:C2H2-type domain-containing protein n=1 Tax=Schistocephalus solidus TaxID=70667 RepID=A0A183T5G4_SCHSO|nr:unnamed protein product [Schistocephalus solidus]
MPCMLRQVQLRWSGHLVRMDDERLPKLLLSAAAMERPLGKDRNLQHPRHAEASATAMERPPGEKGRRATTKLFFYRDAFAATAADATFTTTTTVTTTNVGDSLLACPQFDSTFTSRIGLVGHLRIHRTKTGEPVPGAPTYSRDRRSTALTVVAHSLIA